MNIFLQFLIYLLLLLIILSVFSGDMEILGRPVWSKKKTILNIHRDGPATNQDFLDIYTLTHISHGIIFYLALKYFGLSNKNAIYGAMILEILFEIIENGSFIVDAFRIAPNGTPNYKGDSIINIMSDLLANLLGIYIANISVKLAISYVIISEIIFYKPRTGLLFHISAILNKTKLIIEQKIKNV